MHPAARTVPDVHLMPHPCCPGSLLPGFVASYLGKNGFLFKLFTKRGNELQGGGDAMETCLGISDTSASSRGSRLYLIKVIVVLKYLIRFRHL